MQRQEYVVEILRCLARRSGKAPLNPTIYGDVYNALAKRMSRRDKSDTNVGTEERWKNEIRFAARAMRERGLLLESRAKNVWEISPRGRDFLLDVEDPERAAFES